MIKADYTIEPHALSSKEVLNQLESSQKGLTTEEVEKRQEIFPRNELIGKEPPTLLEIFLDQFKDILIIILIISAIISILFSEEHGAARFQDAIVIVIILLINAIFGTRQEWKADKAIQALQSMTSLSCQVVRDGEIQEIETKELVPGDIIRLEAGDIVPADARLIEAVNLKSVESALTGESNEVNKFALQKFEENTPVAERTNVVYKGTHISFGRGLAVVYATGMKTEFGKIANLVADLDVDQTPIQAQLETVGKQLGYITIAICAAVILLGVATSGDFEFWFLLGVSLAVAAIPEGLPIVVTLAMAIGVQKMAKRNAIVRKLPAVESLGSASIICTDKTGTLTKNQMTVRSIAVFDGNNGFEAHDPDKISKRTHSMDHLFRSAILCNNASLSINNGKIEKEIGDPTETALLRVGFNVGFNYEGMHKRYLKRDEIPFDSARKRMTTVHEDIKEEEFISYTKGAPDVLLDLCSSYLVGTDVEPLTDDIRQNILTKLDEMADDALRVLAFAWKPMTSDSNVWNIQEMEKNLVFVGLMGLIDPPKPEVYDAVRVCQSAGVTIKMVTGDHMRTASAIGVQLNISAENSSVMTGQMLDELSDPELEQQVLDYDIFARISPSHKLRIVQAIKANNRIVGMTGDGVNDAPALKAADIGIAMGINGTDVTKETSDMVLADDNFATIAAAIEEGRAVYQSMGKFLKYMMSSNSAEILVIVGAVLLGLPPPFVPIQILWINLVTDGLPALALGVDPPEPGLMDRPPRDPDENILSSKMAFFILRIAAYMTTISLFIYLYGLDFNFNTTVESENYVYASTLTFATLSIIQLFNSFGCRSTRASVLGSEFFKNKALIYATLTSLLAMMIVIMGDYWISSIFNMNFDFFTDIFRVTSLSFLDWAIIMIISSGVLFLEEFFKWNLRRKDAKMNISTAPS